MLGIRSFAQSFSAKEWDVISKRILDQNAENKMLKQNATADSITMSSLRQAHINTDSVIAKLSRDNKLLLRKVAVKDRELAVKGEENADCEGELKKNKFLKWVFIMSIPVSFGVGYKLGDL